MSDSDEDSTNKKCKKISLDKNKNYKSEINEKYKKSKSPINFRKKFENENKNSVINNSSESESNSNSIKKKNNNIKKISESDSDSSKEIQNSSDSSSNKKKKKKIKKKKISSSYSSFSDDSDEKIPNNKINNNNQIPNQDLGSQIHVENIEIKIKEIEKPSSKNDDKKFLKDKKENEENQITDQIINDLSTNFKKYKGQLDKEMNEIRKHKEFFDKNNFILTDLSCKRMAQIIHYIKSGNPVLLEGDTGTAKTRTSVIACEYLMEFDEMFNAENENKEEENIIIEENMKKEIKNKDKIEKKKLNYIKFNLSAETKIDNLMNKYVGDNRSFSGIKIEMGAFYKSFKKGKILILDEINLASKEVLDCIGQALDNKVLSTELTGKELKSCKMHKNFALIATQNPLKGSFLNKRQNLGYGFFSRFQKVNCEKFNENELLAIAKGLAKKDKIDINEEILINIIKFHIDWEKESSKDSEELFCFTIREIETVLNALKDKNNSPYSIIMNVYGARYSKKEKEKMISLINKYDNLKENQSKKLSLPNNFPICFKNDNLIQAINSILFSLNNLRHVINSRRRRIWNNSNCKMECRSFFL